MKSGPIILGVGISGLALYVFLDNRDGPPRPEPRTGISAPQPTREPIRREPIRRAAAPGPDLPAGAGCQGGRVVVVNKGPEIWTDIKIEVNGSYTHVADAIGSNDTLRFWPNIFTKSDGTRLDLDAVACKSIDIHATVNGQRRHWNGAY